MGVLETILFSIIISWGFGVIIDEPICTVEEIHNQQVVHVPYKCKDILKREK